MIPNSPWNFWIAESDTLEKIGDITKECRDKQLQIAFNRPGAFNCKLPLSTDYVNSLDPVRHCIICRKNDQTVWSGPIWTKQESLHEATITINCVGWLQILMKRILLADVTFEGLKRGQIIHELLEVANTHYPTWITPGTNTETGGSYPDLTRSFDKYAVIGSSIEALTEEESGPNIEVDPSTRELNIRAWDDFENRENVIMSFNRGTNNLSGFGRSFDADSMVNEIHVTGQSVQGFADDEFSQEHHNQVFQEVVTVSDTNDATLLGAIANAELVVNSYPRILYNVSPKTNSSEISQRIGSFFEDFFIGDQIYISAKRYEVDITKHPVRIFSVDMNIDMNGSEQISNLGITYQSG